jgi:hypothetical protein
LVTTYLPSIPPEWVYQNIRVYANGYNLLSLDNLKEFGVDPEVSTTSGLQYPQSKIVNIGLNITF